MLGCRSDSACRWPCRCSQLGDVSNLELIGRGLSKQHTKLVSDSNAFTGGLGNRWPAVELL